MVAIHKDSLAAGPLRFPIHLGIHLFFQAFNLAPTQLSLNSYKYATDTIILWNLTYPNSPLTLEFFLHIHTTKKEKQGWYHMSSKPTKTLVTRIPNKVSNIKPRWFYVEGDSWELGIRGDRRPKPHATLLDLIQQGSDYVYNQGEVQVNGGCSLVNS